LKTILRIVIIGIGTVVLGIGINQLHENGIPWRVLRLSFPLQSSQVSFYTLSTDSSFSFHFDPVYQFIDIREKNLFDIDHIPNAVSLPFQDIFRKKELMLDSLATRPILVYDQNRNSSNAELTAGYFCHQGCKNVMIMRGGFIEWLDRGYPVEQGIE